MMKWQQPELSKHNKFNTSLRIYFSLNTRQLTLLSYTPHTIHTNMYGATITNHYDALS